MQSLSQRTFQIVDSPQCGSRENVRWLHAAAQTTPGSQVQIAGNQFNHRARPHTLSPDHSWSASIPFAILLSASPLLNTLIDSPPAFPCSLGSSVSSPLSLSVTPSPPGPLLLALELHHRPPAPLLQQQDPHTRLTSSSPPPSSSGLHSACSVTKFLPSHDSQHRLSPSRSTDLRRAMSIRSTPPPALTE